MAKRALKESQAAAPNEVTIQIPTIRREQIRVWVRGISDLIVHNMDRKTVLQLLKKHMQVDTDEAALAAMDRAQREKFDRARDRPGVERKKDKKGREAKDLQECMDLSKYLTDKGKDGFPTIGFKCAMKDAVTFLGTKSVTKVLIGGAVFVQGQLVELEYDACEMSIMPTRVGPFGQKQPNIAVRALYKGWKAKLTIEYLPHLISRDQVVQLLNVAGFSCGVGEWRPKPGGDGNGGQYGRFEVMLGEVA